MKKVTSIYLIVLVVFAAQLGVDQIEDSHLNVALWTTILHAEEEDEEAEEEEDPRPERKIAPTGIAIYEKLSKFTEAMAEAGEARENGDTERAQEYFEKAQEVLDNLLKRTRGLNGNEMSQIHRSYVLFAFETENDALAVKHLELALQFREEVPYVIEEQILFQLSQYAFQAEDFETALSYAMEWLELTYKQNPGQIYYIALIYWQLAEQIEDKIAAEIEARKENLGTDERLELEKQIRASYQDDLHANYNQVINYIGIAIESREAGGEEVKESWWQILVSAYDRLEQYEQSLEIWSYLATYHPKKLYFLGLNKTYTQLGQEKKGVYALDVAFSGELLDKSTEIERLAGYVAGMFTPVRGLWILEAARDQELLDIDAKVLKSMGQYANISREVDLARTYLEELTELEPDATSLFHLGSAYSQLRRDKECIAAAEESLEVDDDDLRDADLVRFLLITCLISDGELSEAEDLATEIRSRALREEDDLTVTRAKGYLDYIKSLREQIQFKQDIEQMEEDYRQEKARESQQG